MKTPLLIGALALVLSGGCGGDDSPTTDGPPTADAPPTADGPPTADARRDAAGGTFALTVKNYLSWCDVSVNGGPPAGGAQQVVNVSPGAIALTAVAHVGFQLGTTPWHDTDGDTGNGEQGTVTGSGQSASSATTETITTAPSCVWVCCEFTGGGGCDVADQCP